MADCHHRGERPEDRLRGAAAVRRRRVSDHARRDVRGSRRRLARPRRALADHRGRVRRGAQGRRRRQDQDRRRRDRPGRAAGFMSRSVVITGMGAVTPLGIGARTLYERWLAGESGIADGKGEATEFDPTEHLSIKEARRADRFSQFAIVAGDEALAEAGWEINGEKPYDSDRIGSHHRHRHRRHRDARARQGAADRVGAEEGPAAVRAADDEQRRVRHAVAALRPARQLVRHRLGLLGRRARDRHLRAPDRRPETATRSSPAAPKRHSRRSRGPRSARSTRSRTRASRARSTRAATASSWARAPRS